MKNVALGCVAALLMASPALAGSSTAQNSCSEFRLAMQLTSVTISALCANGSGGFTSASVDLRGVRNDNGTLVQQGNGPSTYQRSCRDSLLTWDSGGLWLNALCQDGNSEWISASIEIMDIHNNQGVLIGR